MDPKELRVLFVGRENGFNYGIAKWLEENYHLVGVFYNEPSRFRSSTRLKRIKRRMKHHGVLAILDELIFHAFIRCLMKLRGHEREWSRKVPDRFTTEDRFEKAETYVVENVHSERWLEKTRQLAPDVIFTACGTVIYKRAFYQIPRLGTFVVHEGLTPEYRGLHTAVWAIMNAETEYLGVTVLKIDDSIDGGKVLFQKRYEMEDDEGILTWSLVAHRGIVTALPELKEAVDRLARDETFEPMDLSGRKDQYFTWMRMSSFLWRLIKNWRKIPLR